MCVDEDSSRVLLILDRIEFKWEIIAPWRVQVGQTCDNKALFACAVLFGAWDSREGDEPAQVAGG